MTKPIRILHLDHANRINLPDFDTGEDLDAVERALLAFGAEPLKTMGTPLEEVRLFRLESIEIALAWDGFTTDLFVVGGAEVHDLFAALAASPLFDVYRTGDRPHPHRVR